MQVLEASPDDGSCNGSSCASMHPINPLHQEQVDANTWQRLIQAERKLGRLYCSRDTAFSGTSETGRNSCSLPFHYNLSRFSADPISAPNMSAGKRAAPSRKQPIASTELEAGSELKLGEFSDVASLSLSEARIILEKVIDTRAAQGFGHEEAENTTKTRDYLEIFANFKEQSSAEGAAGLVDYGNLRGLEPFESAQMKSLLPTCADEAKALIPSLEKKCENRTIDEDTLEEVCRELQKLKRSAEL